jgi:hypothetical protein
MPPQYLMGVMLSREKGLVWGTTINIQKINPLIAAFYRQEIPQKY